MTDAMRSSFEANQIKIHGAKNVHFARLEDGKYASYTLQTLYEHWCTAWTQSRAQPIRLPDAQCYVALDSIGKKNRVSGANDMRELCAGAIKAAGYSVE